MKPEQTIQELSPKSSKKKKYWFFFPVILLIGWSSFAVPFPVAAAFLSIYLATAVFIAVRLILKTDLLIPIKVILMPLLAVAFILISFFPLMPAFIGRVIYADTYPDKGEHIPEYKLRGVIVNNATYSFGYSHQEMDFDVTEEGFRELASRFSQPLLKIGKNPFMVRKMKGDIIHGYEMPNQYHSVENGMYSIYLQKNGGGYQLVFDRDKNRGYYRASAR